MTRLRVFIAVDPGKSIRSRCVSLQETLARTSTKVRWVKPESIHVTLLFLGEVDERQLVPVCQSVAQTCAAHDDFVMAVDGVGCFPNRRRPHTIWVGIGAGTQNLVALHDALEPPLMELGYRREDRQYTPHLTLGRVQGPSTPQLTEALTKQLAWHGGEIAIEEVLIMSSELRADGPIYSVISTAQLRKKGDSAG